MKTLSYSYVKYSPRVPLLLLTVKKIKRENFNFVVPLPSSSSFPSCITQKVYSVYKLSSHQTTALLQKSSFSWLELQVN